MPDTIVVVPCYNEASRLDRAAFQQFAAQNSDIGFLFVNDGSRDDTLALLTQLAERNPARFSVLNLAANAGKAEAVRKGVLAAIERGPRYVAFWDADLATPLAAVPQFVDVLDRHRAVRLAVGARLNLLGHRIERRPLRRLLGRVFAQAASFALGLPIRDTQCGAKMFRVDDETAAVFQSPFCSRWIFDVELIARLLQHQRSRGATAAAEPFIFELPLENWRDVAGSKLKKSDFLRAVGELLSIYRRYVMGARRHIPEIVAPVEKTPAIRQPTAIDPKKRAA